MEPVSKRHWQLRSTVSEEAVETVASSLNLPFAVAEVLVRRGLDNHDEIITYFEASLNALPEPSLLPGMSLAAQRIATAVLKQEKILIHGDYDVDGITATALLVEFLRACHAAVEYHIPLRLKDGYGLSSDAIRKARDEGVDLIVSVDCGITAVDEASLAKETGVELIITDHHQPGDLLPCAHSIVNPHLDPCDFPDRNLAGVGVAFFLAIAVRRALREKGYFQGVIPDLRDTLDLVALGTIADVVPLRGTNRLLVRKGLELVSRASRPGVQALLDVSGVKRVTCGSVGYQLAPRLNAAGRLEDASAGVELLLCHDHVEALKRAQQLDLFNRERRELEEATLSDALQKVSTLEDDRRSLVLWSEGWHSGVIGIVASRLVEKFHRPTLLIACGQQEGKGSGRSVTGFQLFQALKKCEGTLKGFGGHAMAAGFSVAVDEIEAFSEKFEQICQASEALEKSEPHITYDAEIEMPVLTESLVQSLERFAPFGAGNPEPIFLMQGIRAQQLQNLNGGHVRFLSRQDGATCKCIAFGMQHRVDEFAGDLDVLVAPQLNRWNGRKELQLVVKDVRPHAGSSA